MYITGPSQVLVHSITWDEAKLWTHKVDFDVSTSSAWIKKGLSLKLVADDLFTFTSVQRTAPPCILQHAIAPNSFSNMNVIATDGSWKEFRNGPFHHNRTIQTGAAAVLMSTETRQPLATVVVHDCYVDSPRRAYMQEYLALLIGTALSCETGRSPIVTDCKAVLASLSGSYRQNPLFPVAHAIRQTVDAPIQWTPSHQDRVKLASNMSDKDVANKFADAAADGRIANANVLQTEDILPHIRRIHSFIIESTVDDRPILSSLRAVLDSNKAKKYWENRNERKGVNHFSATNVWLSLDPSSSFQSRRAFWQLHLEWFDDDRQHLNGIDQPRGPCSCGCDNLLHTWCRNCTNAPIVALRNTALDKVRQLIGPFRNARDILTTFLQSDQAVLARGHKGCTQRTSPEIDT
jgi:hypothetical protein